MLKELKFAEGRGTGIPKSYQQVARNGSPPPRLETNEERSYFLIKITIHPEMLPSVISKAPVKALVILVNETKLSAFGEITGEDTGEVAGEVLRLVKVIVGKMRRFEIQQALGLKHEVSGYLSKTST